MSADEENVRERWSIQVYVLKCSVILGKQSTVLALVSDCRIIITWYLYEIRRAVNKELAS